MKEERYFYVPDAAAASELPQEEAMHALRVLRLTEGDEISLVDGEGTLYRAVITSATGKHCHYDIAETLPQQRPWRGRLHIAMAPTKMMERTEWMAEKVTEIGVDELSFPECRFSERRKMRKERIEKVVVAAMKQSHKAWMPQVNDMCAFKQFIDNERGGRKYICHCYNEIERRELTSLLRESAESNAATGDTSDEDVTILIGPEGDFSVEEVRYAISKGYKSTSLGPSRLRTETAAIVAATVARFTN
jgi:16S rRNA (uracil1498-N3)-methyltransferase